MSSPFEVGVFETASTFATRIGAEVAIRHLDCGCYRLAAPASPDSLADCRAVQDLASTATALIARTRADGSGHVETTLHHPDCRVGRSV
ncbi:hypothetical protein ACIQBJ_02645 [Kitasatospora sp. NPDC088391]|uniref:hypothetical protein n=1 Tax=Kitasatospora sp. NPDC088391 TaxID=3364074 RepID=UPI0037F318C5